MMKLPKFEAADPSTAELRVEQERLHTQADKMLTATGIRELFAHYGEPQPIGGSYAYNLMVYPDIDLHVITPEVTPTTISGLLGDLATSGFIRKISWVDTVHFPSRHHGRPTGYWFGLEIPFEGDDWGMDCWVQQPEWATNGMDYAERLAALDKVARDTILRMKYDLIRQGLYGKHYQSADVYDAVLAGITDTDSFLRQ